MEFEDFSYDILEWFPIRFCQDVFQYLNGKDVLEASAVNKEWFKFTGETQQMEKVKLVSFSNLMNRQKGLDCEIKEMLWNSKRKYQHIKLEQTTKKNMAFFAAFIASRVGSWKSIDMFSSEIEDQQILFKIIQAIEPSVEEVSIFLQLGPDNSVRVDPKWTFPCLKSLRCLKPTQLEYFVNCTSLIFFCWLKTYDSEHEAKITQNILTLLRNNHKLKAMNAFTDGLILEHTPEFKFKLKSFIVGINSRASTTEHLYSFLETQAQTLESLKIEAKLNRDCLELILAGMPELTSLTTDYPSVKEAITSRQHEFLVNTTIVSLDLGYNPTEPWDTLFETLIRALPGLKHLKCPQIADEQFILLVHYVPALESLNAISFDVSTFPEGNILPNIKKFKTLTFSRDLQEPTGDGNFAALVRQGMRDWNINNTSLQQTN